MVSGSPDSSAILTNDNFGTNHHLPASALIEWVASRSSSSVFVYDLAEDAGFGTLTKEWAEGQDGSASVVSLETRSGAGLSLVGRLSREGTSKDADKGTVLTAYTTPTGLAVMAPSLAYLSTPTPISRLVIQVPTVTPVGSTLALSPTLAPLTSVLNTLPDTFSVILSATPQESLELATLAYSVTDSHVVHLFDQHSSAREVGHIVNQPLPSREHENTSLRDALNDAGFSFFNYAGDNEARVVVVLPNGPLAATAKALATRSTGLGVLTVRVLRPWDSAAFRNSLPRTVNTVHVLDDVPTEATQGCIYADVFYSLLESEKVRSTVLARRIVPMRTQEYLETPALFSSFLASLVPNTPATAFPSIDLEGLKRLLFFSTPTSPLFKLPHHISKSFINNHVIRTRLLTDHDSFSRPGGMTVTRLLLSQKGDIGEYIPIPVLLPLSQGGEERTTKGTADFLAVLDHSLFKSHSVLKSLKRGASLLIFTSWSASEIMSNLSTDDVTILCERDIKVYRMDIETMGGNNVSEKLLNVLGHLAFLRLYLGQGASEPWLRKLARAAYGDTVEDIDMNKLNAQAWAALEEVEVIVPVSAEGASEEDFKAAELKTFEFNTVDLKMNENQSTVASAHLGTWRDAAKHILFPDSYAPPYDHVMEQDEYPPNPALRPEVPDRTYLVTCTVNRRLTPLEYDRNVFHLEFDASGTGLKYAIGEALGIHGWNDTRDVLDFCDWYGVDPNRVITIPVPSGDGKMHTRTIFQALQQQIDLFGRPPKSFYADLAGHATVKEDKLSLEFIGSPEGSSTFKKLAEKDTVTFADVLWRYRSARPGINLLCEMVGDIKPRHYSIASAQSAVGDRVDLLIVTVDWVTPSGSPRYGQCTRYLAELKIGQKVTVSIKPSVMKLPPDNMQPLILAGLGTGAAPFRAFLQHRAWLAAQGIPIGPLYYYFGSRHQSQEYLYGEEIEAFIHDKIITRAGLAFSRDQKNKIYIQHKMIDDAKTLVKMLHAQEGVFYLCGPTWPVPDVYETLVSALITHIGMGPKDAAEYLESLKEEERYVLEVY